MSAYGVCGPVEKEIRRRRRVLRFMRDTVEFGAAFVLVAVAFVLLVAFWSGDFLKLPLWPFLLCVLYWVAAYFVCRWLQGLIEKVEFELRRELAGTGQDELDTVFDKMEERKGWW